MRIYLSSRVLRPRQSGGIVAYFLGLTQALAETAPEECEFHAGLTLHGGDFPRILPSKIQCHWLSGFDAQHQAASERALLQSLKPDWVIYFVADPLNDYGDGSFRVATCIADLQHLHLPQYFPPSDRRARDEAFSGAAGSSDLVFTLSDFCRLDLARAFGRPAEQFAVISPALRGPFVGAPATSAARALVRERFRLPADYAIYPGNFWKHKNHERLLNVFSAWYEETRSAPGAPPHLVLVGSEVGNDRPLRDRLDEGRRTGWLSVLGYVDDIDLHALMSGARCLVFPSQFEGFGLPVLEALSVGLPVACANSTSLPEVGGDLPHYFDPADELQMQNALRAAWDQNPDADFSKRATAQVEKFQYRKSAQLLHASLKAPARAPNPSRSRAEFALLGDAPLVSIVTPSYQQGPFLRQCIESVLQQDYPHVEYMVFDGGSTDESGAILRSYGDRFHWESGPDGGQTNAINKGLRRARGEILAYLNSDDFLLPDAISKVVRAWRLSPSVDVFYGKAYWTDESGEITSPYPTQEFGLESFRGECFICQPAAFWRRATLERFGFFDERFQVAMDYEFWQRIAAQGGLLVHLDDFLACSRTHEATKTRSQRRGVFKDVFASQWRHWGAVHQNWWVGMMQHLADERGGGWPYVIPSKGKHRRRLAEKLSRVLRRPRGFRFGSRRGLKTAGFFPDGWVAPHSWVDVQLAEPRELNLSGLSPTDNDVKIRVNGRDLCRATPSAGEPFQLTWKLDSGLYRVRIESQQSRPSPADRETAFLLKATNLFLT